jgi:hypothetical protein
MTDLGALNRFGEFGGSDTKTWQGDFSDGRQYGDTSILRSLSGAYSVTGGHDGLELNGSRSDIRKKPRNGELRTLR